MQKYCRHVSYIQSTFVAKILKVEEPEVVNEEKHQCFVPTCPGKIAGDLKQFFSMGNPPMNTYHPINYIGIGIHNETDTAGWYTAYVPINIRSFGDDIYKLSRALLRLIDSGTLWLPTPEAGAQQDGSSVQGHADGASYDDSGDGTSGYAAGRAKRINSTQNAGVTHTSHATEECNVFRHQFTPLAITDQNRYIFATPSCMYATMPEISSTLSFNGLPVDLRMMIEVRVKPHSYTVGGTSIPNLGDKFDSCFPNDAIEWYIPSVEHVIPQRMLFRILKKDAQHPRTPTPEYATNSHIETPVTLPETKTHSVDLISVMPSSNVLFVTENNFQMLRGIYNSVMSKDDAVVFQEGNLTSNKVSLCLGGVTQGRGAAATTFMSSSFKPSNLEAQFINIKLKWTEHNNKVIFYLKSLINTKWLIWDCEDKLWRVNSIFLYEAVKFALYLGLRVAEKVLFELWSWLQSIDMRGIGEIFSKTHFTQWVNTTKVWAFQRIKICVMPGFNPAIHKESEKGVTPAMQALARENAETVEIHLIPFNKELVAKFKERNAKSSLYIWQKQNNSWITAQLKATLEDLLTVLPNLKEMAVKDTYLSSRGINLRDLHRTQKRHCHGQINIPLKRVAREDHESDSDEEFTTVTKLIITAAGKGAHLMRIKDKINTVIEKIQPPSSSISASGKVIHGGAGTGGIEFVEIPRGCEGWNTVSFCIVPDEHDGQIPVEQYDPNLLASLIAEVFIVKESAIDYLLANYKRWPGPHDTVSYTRWNQIVTRNEPRCWGGGTFDGRQLLAQTRLFCDEDFFITGDNKNNDAILCRLLIQLGNGKIVNNAQNAEYVIITDKLSDEAQELNRQFGNNDEDLIANTHGARHSTLVTPKFIYDCILQWKLQRPTRSHGHMAF